MLRIAREIPRRIVWSSIDRTFEVYVDGRFIGYAPTYIAGYQLANETVYDWLRFGIIGDRPAGFRRVYAVGRRHYQRRRAA